MKKLKIDDNGEDYSFVGGRSGIKGDQKGISSCPRVFMSQILNASFIINW